MNSVYLVCKHLITLNGLFIKLFYIPNVWNHFVSLSYNEIYQKYSPVEGYTRVSSYSSTVAAREAGCEIGIDLTRDSARRTHANFRRENLGLKRRDGGQRRHRGTFTLAKARGIQRFSRRGDPGEGVISRCPERGLSTLGECHLHRDGAAARGVRPGAWSFRID